jgi:multidrug resistance efflux pump
MTEQQQPLADKPPGDRPPAAEPAPEPAPVRQEDPLELPEGTEEEAAPPPRGWAPQRSGPKMTILFVVVLLAGALLALYAWDLPPFHNRMQTTDNAFVRGQTTVIAPQVSGYVTRVYVQDFEQVPAGAPLVQIDDRIYRQRVAQAEANLQAQLASLANSTQSQRSSEASVRGQEAAIASARAQRVRAQADMTRIGALYEQRWVTGAQRDQAIAALRQAEAAVRQAEAQRNVAQEQVRTVTVGRGGLEAGVANARAALRLAQIDLANTLVRAPQPGQTSEIGVRLGQFVTAGTQLLFVVPARIWVTANFKEAQTAEIRPGQRARVRVDALGGQALAGHVEQLSPAAGSEFSVIRPDNATGNFVKVPQRIAVRIVIDPGQEAASRLRPGMSVEASVDTGSDR